MLMTQDTGRKRPPLWAKVALPFLTLASLFYLFVVPMVAALSPQSYGISGVLFGGLMLAQLILLVGLLAHDAAREMYGYKVKSKLLLFFSEPKLKLFPDEPQKGAAGYLVILPIMLSFSFLNYAFSVLYVYISSINPSSFSTERPLGVIESIYFSVVTAATVGYGDIAPKSDIARLAVIAQVSISLLYVIIFFSAFASHLRDHSTRLERASHKEAAVGEPNGRASSDGP